MKTKESRFQVHDELTAPERSLPILKGALAGGGQLSNIVGVLAGSPAVLRAYARMRSELRHGALPWASQQRIALAVAEYQRSEYALSTLQRTAREAGLGLDEIALAREFEGGMGFDGSSITGFNAIEESDMIAMPDPRTFAVLPWRPEDKGVARMFCDVVTPSREPYEGDPRHVLRRALERAESMGFTNYYVGPELEYFYFRNARPENGVPEILDEGGYFDLTTLDAGSDVRRETVLALEQLGIHVEYT